MKSDGKISQYTDKSFIKEEYKVSILPQSILKTWPHELRTLIFRTPIQARIAQTLMKI